MKDTLVDPLFGYVNKGLKIYNTVYMRILISSQFVSKTVVFSFMFIPLHIKYEKH